ncbi:MAG: 50S ribosomal protein L23 [Termitinemataceae bacterium]|nr:MAG: 50S ribosomal protein L23 [Termitinemataceae bacterium]
MIHEQVLIEPILSEKSNILRESNKYVFKVDPRANKAQIREAVSKLFNVHAKTCTTMNVAGKPKRQRAIKGLTPGWKKAIVTLAKGEKIALFEGV